MSAWEPGSGIALPIGARSTLSDRARMPLLRAARHRLRLADLTFIAMKCVLSATARAVRNLVRRNAHHLGQPIADSLLCRSLIVAVARCQCLPMLGGSRSQDLAGSF